ncbi:hypothetical protein JI666_09405 [Bacillus sp. NTK071]|uniref:hypothetical protein n=1 Tax=Bacillus sp. NTK071 TaxID=2802175 RepID=UPI001A8EB549|nr:hypothetical protein [Bacillus sp. NTK071]MBN8208961.1 hypothetical protein [Bacillus sp. NTK071]
MNQQEHFGQLIDIRRELEASYMDYWKELGARKRKLTKQEKTSNCCVIFLKLFFTSW